MTVGDLIDPRAWAEDPDWPGRRTGNRRTTQVGNRRPTGAIPLTTPSGPPNVPAAARVAPNSPVQSMPVVTSPSPPPSRLAGGTPGPDQLADALEPLPPPSSVATHRWIGKGVLIGVPHRRRRRGRAVRSPARATLTSGRRLVRAVQDRRVMPRFTGLSWARAAGPRCCWPRPRQRCPTSVVVTTSLTAPLRALLHSNVPKGARDSGEGCMALAVDGGGSDPVDAMEAPVCTVVQIPVRPDANVRFRPVRADSLDLRADWRPHTGPTPPP
jgi:hypothetical protein